MDSEELITSLQYGAIIIGLTGGLALFLYGMRKMTEALKTIAGDKLKMLFAKLTTNRFTGTLAGALITALIQSSSITTVLVVGFISAGLMSFQQSIGVIIGSNIGSTVTAQLIAFKITKYGLIMITIGFLIEVVSKRKNAKQIGIIITGLGFIFFGMELMSSATTPLRSYKPFIDLMTSMHNPFCRNCWCCHSTLVPGFYYSGGWYCDYIRFKHRYLHNRSFGFNWKAH
jgi:phosphate:Na+ symporter